MPGKSMQWEHEWGDTFGGADLDESKWIPHYLPQWSSRDRSRARHSIRDGQLVLAIEETQEPWAPELDGELRVSNLQTGVYSGPVGSRIGQHQFRDGLLVTEEQPAQRLYTPHFARIEATVKAIDDPRCMVALWMIGFEDAPQRSAEICIFEIFGSEVTADGARVGMGVHPFADPSISDDFEKVSVDFDVREFHNYAVDWTQDRVTFFIDDRQVKTVEQSPQYPMQLMLSIYEFEGDASGPYPKEFIVDEVRGSSPITGTGITVARGA